MNAPQTVEEWIALALAQGVVEKRESLPFTGSRGEVIEGRPLVEWIRNRVAFPYDCGLDHGALQWPISDEQRNDPEFMRGYAAGVDERRQNQQVDRRVQETWERLNLSGILTSSSDSSQDGLSFKTVSSAFSGLFTPSAPSSSSGAQCLHSGSMKAGSKSFGSSCIRYFGLLSLALFCIRFFANLGGSDDVD